MKKILFVMSVILTTNLQSQNHSGGIPPNHIHSTSICYGYAMGRAHGRLAGDAVCNPMTLNVDRVDDGYFDYVSDSSLSGLRQGDIIAFGSRSGLGGHAAFVVQLPTNNTNLQPTQMAQWLSDLDYYSAAQIYVDQVPYSGGSEERKRLDSVII